MDRRHSSDLSIFLLDFRFLEEDGSVEFFNVSSGKKVENLQRVPREAEYSKLRPQNNYYFKDQRGLQSIAQRHGPNDPKLVGQNIYCIPGVGIINHRPTVVSVSYYTGYE